MTTHNRRPIAQPPTSPTWLRLNRLTSCALVLAVDAQAVRLLLLDHRASGAVTLCRARCWPAPAPPGAVLAAAGTAYCHRPSQSPISVHLVYSDRAGQWPALLRCAVGPLADVTEHPRAEAEAGWRGAARIGLAALGIDPHEDPEYVAVLVERAIARTGRE